MSGFTFDTSFSSFRENGFAEFYGRYGLAFSAYTFNARYGPTGTYNERFEPGCASGFFASYKYGNSGFFSGFCPAGFCASGFNAAAYFNTL